MKLTIVSDGDYWEGLYVDGELACEGHCVTVNDVAAAVGVHITSLLVDSHWMADRGNLPKKLSKVQLADE